MDETTVINMSEDFSSIECDSPHEGKSINFHLINKRNFN
jgi:hypothetical protein